MHVSDSKRSVICTALFRSDVYSRIDEVIVCAVVAGNETEANAEASHRGTPPRDTRIRGPGKDEHADGDEPTTAHHGNQSLLCRRLATEFCSSLVVVHVDEGGEESTRNDTDGERNEHETSCTRRIALAFLVDDREAMRGLLVWERQVSGEDLRDKEHV